MRHTHISLATVGVLLVLASPVLAEIHYFTQGSTLYRTENGGPLRSVEIFSGGAYKALAFDPEVNLWGSNTTDHTFYKINPDNGNVTMQFPYGLHTGAVDIPSFDFRIVDNTLQLFGMAGDTAYVFNAETGGLISSNPNFPGDGPLFASTAFDPSSATYFGAGFPDFTLYTLQPDMGSASPIGALMDSRGKLTFELAGGAFFGGEYWSGFRMGNDIAIGTIDTGTAFFSERWRFSVFVPPNGMGYAVQDCVPAPPNLVSWWPGDGNANDIQDGNHGTLQNGATFAAGKVGQAFSFDGVDDFVDYGSDASLNVGDGADFTVDGWFKTTDSFGTILSQRTNESPSVPVINITVGFDSVETNAGRLMGFVRDDDSPLGVPNFARVTGGVVDDGNWHFFTLVRTGAAIELFLDGVSQGIDTSVHADGPITTNLRAFGSEQNWVLVGFGSADQRWLNGLVDEVEFFNRALSPLEIQALFNAGSAGKCKPCPADVNGDLVVNVLDLIALLLCFGQPAVPVCEAEDVNEDGTVNVLDLIALLRTFGMTCP